MFNTFNYSNLYYAGRKALRIVLKKVYQKSVNKMSVISYKRIMRLESGVRGGKQTPSGELSTDTTERSRPIMKGIYSQVFDQAAHLEAPAHDTVPSSRFGVLQVDDFVPHLQADVLTPQPNLFPGSRL
jgi:hypothetical protein